MGVGCFFYKGVFRSSAVISSQQEGRVEIQRLSCGEWREGSKVHTESGWMFFLSTCLTCWEHFLFSFAGNFLCSFMMKYVYNCSLDRETWEQFFIYVYIHLVKIERLNYFIDIRRDNTFGKKKIAWLFYFFPLGEKK